MAKLEQWNTASLRPLSGPLDIRSRPADIPPGAYRYKGNISITDEGKLCRRAGFSRAFSDRLYDSNGDLLSDPNHTGTGVYVHNHDHHHQGVARQPISFLYESTANDGTRRLFDGTKDRISLLNESTGDWTDIANVSSPDGSRWKAAGTQDYVLFTNGYSDILAHQLGTTTTATIPELVGRTVTAAKVIIEFKGVIFLMNVIQNGTRQISRIIWNDLNSPLGWSLMTASTIAGAQDLDYGDEILAAGSMGDSVEIYTRRAIWRLTVAPATATSPFTFKRVYSEPKNQAGCLVYPNTLIATGTTHYYMSREGIYRWTPFLAEPERPEWLHAASGVIYDKDDTKLLGIDCASPVGEYVSVKKELRFSWPSGINTLNNWQLAMSVQFETGDVIDTGAVCYCNSRRNPDAPALCNEVQSFLFVSSIDYAIKQDGGVFYREFLTNPTSDPAATEQPALLYLTVGYNSILRGMVPLGFTDRDKIIRKVLFGFEATDQDVPCVVRLRIGNSFVLVDANSLAEKCAALWRTFDDKQLACVDAETLAQMRAQNLRPAENLDSATWDTYEQGRFLYFEFTILNADGTPGIGGECFLQRIDFDAMAMVKA